MRSQRVPHLPRARFFGRPHLFHLHGLLQQSGGLGHPQTGSAGVANQGMEPNRGRHVRRRAIDVDEAESREFVERPPQRRAVQFREVPVNASQRSRPQEQRVRDGRISKSGQEI